MKRIGLLRLAAFSLLFLHPGLPWITHGVLAAETENIDRCRSIPLENAASILDVAADDLLTSSNDLQISPDDLRDKTYSSAPYNCTIRSQSNFLQSITYTVYPYSDPVQARIEFNRMRDGFASVSKVDEVPDVGGEAFRAGDQRFQRLVVKKGAYVIDILNPKELNLQKIIALFVVDGL